MIILIMRMRLSQEWNDNPDNEGWLRQEWNDNPDNEGEVEAGSRADPGHDPPSRIAPQLQYIVLFLQCNALCYIALYYDMVHCTALHFHVIRYTLLHL